MTHTPPAMGSPSPPLHSTPRPSPPSPLWVSILICICYGNCSHGGVQRGSGPPVSLLFVSGKVNKVFIFTHRLCPGHGDVAASAAPGGFKLNTATL